MANLPETPQWEDGIYQIEVSDPVLGGPDGITNRPIKQLASRTLYLKQQVEQGASDLADHIAADDPHTQYAPKESPTFTGTPTAPTPASSDNSKKLATTEFVARIISALTETVSGKLSQEQNGADIPDPEEFVKNLGLGEGGFVGRLVAVRRFTSSGTYTPSPGVKNVIIEAVGGGGGGGGAAATSSIQSSIGNGGLAGDYVRTPLIAAESWDITVGSGGSGVSSGAAGIGGNTSVGSIIKIRGGDAGLSGVATASSFISGGYSSNTDTEEYPVGSLYIRSSAPTRGLILDPGGSSTRMSCPGAGSPLGNGGGATTSYGTGSTPPSGYGGGGAGAMNAISMSESRGGSGASGAVIIWEFA